MRHWIGLILALQAGDRGDLASRAACEKAREVWEITNENQDRMIEVFRTLLGRDPSYQGGVYVWWQVPS